MRLESLAGAGGAARSDDDDVLGRDDAGREARREGAAVAHAHLRHINPFPANLGDVLRGYDRVLVPEMNSGQLALLIRGTYLVDVLPYNRVRGLPFTTAELTEQIHTLLKELSA